jgi:hypothetical protein
LSCLTPDVAAALEAAAGAVALSCVLACATVADDAATAPAADGWLCANAELLTTAVKAISAQTILRMADPKAFCLMFLSLATNASCYTKRPG